MTNIPYLIVYPCANWLAVYGLLYKLHGMLYYASTGNQNNLRSAAYEALMELIKNSPRDCYEHVKNTTVIILERLRAILQMEVSENCT